MMAVTPIYEADNVVMQLEREQRLREDVEKRREELMQEHSETIKEMVRKETANNDSPPARNSSSRHPN